MPSHMPRVRIALALLLLIPAGQRSSAQQAPYRTLNDAFAPPESSSLSEWNRRADYLRDHIRASAGLLPMPERTPLRPVIFGEVKHADYSVSKAYFEALPGFLVTGNVYRPVGDGPFPAILSPHGHWAYGRLENTPTVSVPGRAINLARQGFVVFTYDLIGYNDSRQLVHRQFGGPREKLWGLSIAGLQLWSGIRGLDFLESLPYVKRDALGATGASGGGTQTFLLAAIDERIKAAVPVNMISLHMQGGCLCENLPGLRLDTTNVEIAATIAPRPLLMVSATEDWTTHTMEREYPAVRALYLLAGATDRVRAVQFEAVHNYNRDSREEMYAWMARWLQGAPADVRRPETTFTPDSLADLLVFHQRAVPADAVTDAELTSRWIEAAARQLSSTPLETRARMLRHALNFDAGGPSPRPLVGSRRGRTVLVAGLDAAQEGQLRASGLTVKAIAFTPFDAEAASKIQHFDTYNRTAASQRVADIVAAMRETPDAALVASGDAALAGLLASAIEPGRVAILDVEAFDAQSDAAFVDRLYIPGLRRAGDLSTALALAGDRVVIHNAGDRFSAGGANVRREKIGDREIVALLRK